ncbi:unnamed protein product [Ceutorhynchus assimilis]|uniref:Uncharacterized protein n=1 Tax=Ceutorhynchus assimilis TaxID=467358 RepID=A0A9N9MJ60_9CUCU|nr:unnamed protein product [Ceutorhynchus assimilis]
MFGTMESRTTADLLNTEKAPNKLKFGIERLLSSNNPDENKTFGKANPTISKPLPHIVVPCSDCELYRCCRLGSSGGCQSDMLPGMSGFFNAETYFAFTRNDNALYSGQPIRPFATRPI